MREGMGREYRKLLREAGKESGIWDCVGLERGKRAEDGRSGMATSETQPARKQNAADLLDVAVDVLLQQPHRRGLRATEEAS